MESQFPPSTVNQAIEDSLEEVGTFLDSLNHSDFKIHINALKAAKMESHMKMGDYAGMLWREVVEGTYDYRRHHRECEHLNFLTISKVGTSNKWGDGDMMLSGEAVLQTIHSERGQISS